MLDKKDVIDLNKRGVPDYLILEIDNFLIKNEATLYNVCFFNNTEYRVMFRDKNGKVDAKILNTPIDH